MVATEEQQTDAAGQSCRVGSADRKTEHLGWLLPAVGRAIAPEGIFDGQKRPELENGNFRGPGHLMNSVAGHHQFRPGFGRNLILTPGINRYSSSITVTNANTVVLGLGYADLARQSATAARTVADVDGVQLAGFLIDAGPANSPVLLQVGVKGAPRRKGLVEPGKWSMLAAAACKSFGAAYRGWANPSPSGDKSCFSFPAGHAAFWQRNSK